ncbi:MAG: ABC transporter permease [Planctomycetaceae bacterium]|nr:MAG: ABC transporter permease [Planctomycetaceae bacterium]
MSLSPSTSGSLMEMLRRRVGVLLLVVNIVMWTSLGVIGLVAQFSPSSAFTRGVYEARTAIYVVCSIIVGGQLAVLLSMSTVRAMARQTFSQCIRMKIAAAFIVLLVIAFIVIATCIKGDGTLAGRLRMFLSYSTSIVGIILSLVTVFLAASLISGDIRNKQIFIVAVKPLSRWQYIVGRWMGLVLVNIVLIVPAGIAIYGVAEYMQSFTRINNEPVSPTDRLAVETEIMAARQIVPAEKLDVDTLVQRRIAEIGADPEGLRRMISEYMTRLNCDRDAALLAIETEIRKNISIAAQSAKPYVAPENIKINTPLDMINNPSPGSKLTWDFKGINAGGTTTEGEGKVINKIVDKDGSAFLHIRGNSPAVRKLMYQGPVSIGLMSESRGKKMRDGRVERVTLTDNESTFWMSLPKPFGDDVSKDADVRILIEPAIQATFQTNASLSQDSLKGLWVAKNPTTNDMYIQWREDPTRAPATITIPARIVDDQGRLRLEFINRDAQGITILQQDVNVLYQVGGFGPNLARGMLLILLRLMFLASLGILAGSFLSFPVACIMMFVMLPFALVRSYLDEAIKTTMTMVPSVIVAISGIIYEIMTAVLPDLQQTSPSDMLVDGLSIGLSSNIGKAVFFNFSVLSILRMHQSDCRVLFL